MDVILLMKHVAKLSAVELMERRRTKEGGKCF